MAIIERGSHIYKEFLLEDGDVQPDQTKPIKQLNQTMVQQENEDAELSRIFWSGFTKEELHSVVDLMCQFTYGTKEQPVK